MYPVIMSQEIWLALPQRAGNKKGKLTIWSSIAYISTLCYADPTQLVFHVLFLGEVIVEVVLEIGFEVRDKVKENVELLVW